MLVQTPDHFLPLLHCLAVGDFGMGHTVSTEEKRARTQNKSIDQRSKADKAKEANILKLLLLGKFMEELANVFLQKYNQKSFQALGSLVNLQFWSK